MIRQAGVLPRRAFTKLAQQAGCQLYFPFPNDNVVLLRTGMLYHIKRYMQVIHAEHHSHPIRCKFDVKDRKMFCVLEYA